MIFSLYSLPSLIEIGGTHGGLGYMTSIGRVWATLQASSFTMNEYLWTCVELIVPLHSSRFTDLTNLGFADVGMRLGPKIYATKDKRSELLTSSVREVACGLRGCSVQRVAGTTLGGSSTAFGLSLRAGVVQVGPTSRDPSEEDLRGLEVATASIFHRFGGLSASSVRF